MAKVKPKVAFPARPAGLGPAGAKVWNKIKADAQANGYILNPSEIEILANACRVQDVIAALRDKMREIDLVTTGSAGQPIVHPVVAEVRAQEGHYARLLKAIEIPDPVGVPVNQHRAAGQSTWAAAHGKAG